MRAPTTTSASPGPRLKEAAIKATEKWARAAPGPVPERHPRPARGARAPAGEVREQESRPLLLHRVQTNVGAISAWSARASTW